MTRGRLVMLGDSCVAIQFENAIDPVVNARCVALARSLAGLAIRGVRDVVPTYNAVTIQFDPRVADRRALREEVSALAAAAAPTADGGARLMEVPVDYGGAAGPDLAAVAAFARCSEADVVRLHGATPYRVYMLGFLPGFAYMGPVDARIAMPRLETPRLRVAAGSVGIAGAQTGIYPCDAPGGWRIIGRTDLVLFDPARTEPFLLKAGDRVRFVAA
ncbi:MAG: 5-oxoprolinase subunit PxpB [Acidobacteria bacterium]|nr:MAG: 5-oxoprolinase subunit PxpB [Acidobacteriota bacterium]